MPDDRLPSAFSLWLEEALTGWILPVAALVLAGVAALLYLAGWLPEGATAAALSAVAGILAAVFVARPAVSARADGPGRVLALVAAAGSLFVAAVPPALTVLPGAPLAEGALEARGDRLALPAGLSGRVRLLVRVRLPQGGSPSVPFRLSGAESPIEDKLERTFSYARVGRGGRAAVAHDHSAVFLEARIPSGAPALTLERLGSDAAGPLLVQIFPDPVPVFLQWALAVLVVLAAAAAEARLRQGGIAALAGIAGAFGLLVAENATPEAAVGTAVGAVLLGAAAGAAAGGAVAFLVKRLLPAPPEVRPRGAKGA